MQLERVGIHDNFFELGGDSILATRVLARVREIFRVELPVTPGMFANGYVQIEGARVQEGLTVLEPR